MKQSLIDQIIELLHLCDDGDLLDLVFRLLAKSYQ